MKINLYFCLAFLLVSAISVGVIAIDSSYKNVTAYPIDEEEIVSNYERESETEPEYDPDFTTEYEEQEIWTSSYTTTYQYYYEPDENDQYYNDYNDSYDENDNYNYYYETEEETFYQTYYRTTEDEDDYAVAGTVPDFSDEPVDNDEDIYTTQSTNTNTTTTATTTTATTTTTTTNTTQTPETTIADSTISSDGSFSFQSFPELLGTGVEIVGINTNIIGIVIWCLVAVGLITVFIILLKNKHGSPYNAAIIGKKRYKRSASKSKAKHLLNDKYYISKYK